MYEYNDQFNKPGAAIIGGGAGSGGDHIIMAMRRADDYGFSGQMDAFDPGRGDGPYLGGSGGNFNTFDSYREQRGIFGERPQTGGFSHQEAGGMGFAAGMGQSQLGGGGGRLDEDFYRQGDLPHEGGAGPGVLGYAPSGYGFGPEGDFATRRDSLDRERERDRNRRGLERDRQRNGRRDDNWERGSRRDRSDRDWIGSDRERRRERRTSRERSTRDRSPRDDSNVDTMNYQTLGSSLTEMVKKRQKTAETEAKHLVEADQLSFQAQEQRSFTLVARSNQLRLTAQDKQDEAFHLEKQLNTFKVSDGMEISEDEGRDSPGRDRYRDMDRSRQGSENGRDRDRDRHRDRDRDRDRSRGRDDRDRDRDRDRGDREGERWMTDEPSATVLLRGLNSSLTENDIIQELLRIGMPPKDVRFMRRMTGASRGFGFVEFQTQSEAQRWMDLNQGQITVSGQRLNMHYSAPRVSRDSRDQANKMDWMCKCGAHNFKRRDFCYKCNINRRFAEDPLCGVTELDPATHVGKNPCNTLLFRDLDALTTEQGVLQAIAALTSMAIKNTQVIRDDMGTSLCFAFLELNSVASAKQLHDFLQAISPPLAVDGKQVMVSYAKNTYNTSLDIIMKAQQKLAQNQYYLNYNNYHGQQGQGQDTTSQYYNYYYGTQQTTAAATSTTTAPGNSTNAAAAVAQTAIMQAQAAKAAVAAPAQPVQESTESSQYPVYPPPDVSTYQYDKTSGYYYDPSTGLYYEPNTQYYYNSKTTQWMYWDAEKSTYLPAPTQGMDSTQQTTGPDGTAQVPTEKTDKEDKKEKEKTKVAKKIAKDMEKWAKAMNAQKDAMKEEQRKGTTASGRKESATADAGFAILQKSKEDMKLMPPPPMALNPAPEVQVKLASSTAAAATAATGLVASYGGDSDESGDEEDGGVVDESKLVDWTKLACLLCKRQFQSREILAKHTQFSDLHKKNLENLKANAAGNVEKKEYRDRAKERRQKYGMPVPPGPRKGKQAVIDEPQVVEQPTKAGIGGENIGNKMLQKMGWSQGLGLGKSNQGRTAPVETQRRVATAGLGVKGADIVAEEGATYKENVKKTLFARYNDSE